MSVHCPRCRASNLPMLAGENCPACALRGQYVRVVAAESPEALEALVQRADQVGADEVPRLGLLGFPKLRGALNGLRRRTVYLTSGEPGVGKSTLLTQLADALDCRASTTALYISAEEPREAVVERARRLDCELSRLFVMDDGNLSALDRVLASEAVDSPDLVVVDSIQTVFDPALEARPGSVAQVIHCTNGFKRLALDHNCAVWLLAHITKDGLVAGPKTLEHLVDVVTTVAVVDDRAVRRELAVSKNRRGRLAGPVWFTVQPNGSWREV